MRGTRLLVVAAIVGLFLTGLGGGCKPGLVQVSGTVTLNDQPPPKLRVILTPTGSKGRDAYAITDDAGKFTLTSTTPGDGVAPGEYKVTFALGSDDNDPNRIGPNVNIDPKKREEESRGS